jgi:hypothetical protein
MLDTIGTVFEPAVALMRGEAALSAAAGMATVAFSLVWGAPHVVRGPGWLTCWTSGCPIGHEGPLK